MKYQGHKVEITQDIGKNVIIKRKDGGRFETCSMLRHHGGKKVMAETLSVSKKAIEYSLSEKVDHYVKVMTSKTAKYELPDGDRVERCPHGKEIMKGRPVRCTECYSMDC